MSIKPWESSSAPHEPSMVTYTYNSSTQKAKVGESNQEFEILLSYLVSLRSAWTTWQFVSTKEKVCFLLTPEFQAIQKQVEPNGSLFDLRFPKPTNSLLFPFINSMQINISINMNINVCVNIYYHKHKLLSTVMSNHCKPCNFSPFVIYLKGKLIAQSPCFLFAAS